MPRVLVIEAPAASAHGWAARLSRQDFDVVTASSLAEGWKQLTSGTFDVVLVHAALPDGKAIELLSRLQEDEARRAIPVVYSTDSDEPHGLLAALSGGVSGFLSRGRSDGEAAAYLRRILTECAKKEQTLKTTVSLLGQACEVIADQNRLLDGLTCALEDAYESARRAANEARRRRELEKQLRESEAVYESLVETLPVNLIRKDADFRFTFANKPCCEKFGEPLEQIIGKTDFDFFPEDLARKYRKDDVRVFETGEVFEDIEKYQDPHAGAQYVHVLKAPVHDADGNRCGVQAVFWDVTDRVKAEQELEKSEARKRAIFETSLDCLIISDEEGRIVEFNHAAEQTFGYSRDEVLGKSMDELLFAPSIKDGPKGRKQHRAWFDEQGAYMGKRLEVPLVRRNGDQFIAEMAMQPIPLGGTVHFATVLHDITRRKRHERELRLAKEQAEAANQAKSAFLANMSHEIRTPMNAIIGMTGLVFDTDLTPEQQEHLQIVQDSAESLLSLINDILDFSKIEAGKLDLEAMDFCVRDRLGDTMKSLAMRAHAKGLELACHIAPPVPDYVRGDAGRLRQILVNLVGNAIKFTDEGEVVLDVALVEVNDEDVVLRFEVRDTGIGIPADRQNVIFDAFEQADTSTTRRFGGTGLGLAISSRLVQLMGGSIHLESLVGKGSTFWFTARFQRAEGASQFDRPVIESLRNMRVLVVDDNSTNRKILHEVLTSWDMLAVTVSSAWEAIEALKQANRAGQPFPIVLTDAHMPEADGFTLVERIQSSREFPTPTILMLTSGDRPGDLQRCRELGVARHMTKPVKQSELLDAIGAAFHVVPSPEREKVPAQPEIEYARGLKVLLAEDSVANQKLALGLLKRRDHDVTIATNGHEAIAHAKKERFDMILMDVQMPEMDGLEATRRIREWEAERGIRTPIIAMTAHAMKGDRELCLDAGMDRYLPKPIRPNELFEALEAFVRTPEGAAPIDTANLPEPGGAPASPRMNWDTALEFVGEDIELLKDVVDATLEETPVLLDEFEEALEKGDMPTAQRIAHTIKGSLRTFDARLAMQQASDLETLAKSGDADTVQSRAPEFRSEVEAILNDLRQADLDATKR